MVRVLTLLSLVPFLTPVLLADEPKPDADGFVTLFDGKSMAGWKVNENQKSFSLKDGAIVANGDRSHCFYVGNDRPFKNFHFIAEVMTKPGANGGIYFHTKSQDEGWPAQGHECQVNNSYDKDPQKTGGVYNVAKVLKAPAKDGEWFKYEIIVEGNHVVVKIDGQVTADYTEEPAKDRSADPGRHIDSGTFALQAHDPGSTVLYRNIRVKRLAD
ncbi:MAG: DUF1080 domain-containing protein [Pirellulaceae bacterium]